MTASPPRVTTGEITVCCGEHEVGRVRATLSPAQSIMAQSITAQSITAEAVEVGADAVPKASPERISRSIHGSPAVQVLCDGRRSVRLERGRVS